MCLILMLVMTVDDNGDEIETKLNVLKDFTAFLILIEVAILIANREVDRLMEIKGDLLDGQLIETHEMFVIYQKNEQCMSKFTKNKRITYIVLSGLCIFFSFALISRGCSQTSGSSKKAPTLSCKFSRK